MLNRLTKSVDLRTDARNVTVDKRGIGSITAYAATFTREPDLTGDVIARGAFAKFLARMEEEGAVMPLLYNHDQSLGSFIGKVTDIREDDHGLLFTATFDGTEKAQRARELVMDGRLSKLSFAYLVRDAKEITLPDGRLANELRELDAGEVLARAHPRQPGHLRGGGQGVRELREGGLSFTCPGICKGASLLPARLQTAIHKFGARELHACRWSSRAPILNGRQCVYLRYFGCRPPKFGAREPLAPAMWFTCPAAKGCAAPPPRRRTVSPRDPCLKRHL